MIYKDEDLAVLDRKLADVYAAASKKALSCSRRSSAGASKGATTAGKRSTSAAEVIATFFQTNPPTLIAERGDQVSLRPLSRLVGPLQDLSRE
jgi:hypothetical protein